MRPNHIGHRGRAGAATPCYGLCSGVCDRAAPDRPASGSRCPRLVPTASETPDRFTRVTPDNAPQGGVGLERGGVDADRLPFNEIRGGRHLQDPREHRAVGLQIDQATRPRDRLEATSLKVPLADDSATLAKRKSSTLTSPRLSYVGGLQIPVGDAQQNTFVMQVADSACRGDHCDGKVLNLQTPRAGMAVALQST